MRTDAQLRALALKVIRQSDGNPMPDGTLRHSIRLAFPNVTLTSPPILLGGYPDAVLTFAYWFYNGGGSGTPNDQFQVKVVSNGVATTVFTQTQPASVWRLSGDIHLKDFFPNGLANDMQVQFITGDQTPGHLVEAAVDVFKMEPKDFVALRPDFYEAARLSASPNPSASSFTLRYDWAATSGDRTWCCTSTASRWA